MNNILWKLRVLCFYLVISIFVIIFFLIICSYLRIFNPNYNIKYRFAIVFSHIFIGITKLICGIKYKVEGLEKLPNKPFITLSNHQSFWDNVFMQIIIPKHSWIIKKELFNIPFFGWGLKAFDPVAVDRTSSLSVKQILQQGQKKLQDGIGLVIFPESTRLLPEQTAKFKPSAMKLAYLAKVPIILMAHNAGIYWPKSFWIKKPGTIQVKIISVIYEEEIAQMDVRDLTDMIEKTINKEKQILFEKAIN